MGWRPHSFAFLLNIASTFVDVIWFKKVGQVVDTNEYDECNLYQRPLGRWPVVERRLPMKARFEHFIWQIGVALGLIEAPEPQRIPVRSDEQQRLRQERRR
jgi:hypothetical protein